jgi:hypothetical protein
MKVIRFVIDVLYGFLWACAGLGIAWCIGMIVQARMF